MGLSYSSVQTMTVTNLQSLASSATAAWQSAAVDNSSDLYDDSLVQVVLDFANTAPGSDKAAYVLAYGALDTVYSNPASGSEGTITLTNITNTGQNLKYVGAIPYTTQDEVAESGILSVAAAFGGTLPVKWGLVVVNYSGAALASSGNTVKWVGVKHS